MLNVTLSEKPPALFIGAGVFGFALLAVGGGKAQIHDVALRGENEDAGFVINMDGVWQKVHLEQNLNLVRGE